MSALDLTAWLAAVDRHGHRTREALMEQGHHPNVIYAKAIKSARRGYTDYGVVADRPWLTDKGKAWLTEHGVELRPVDDTPRDPYWYRIKWPA